MVFMYDASGSPIGFMYRYSSYAVNEWIIYWYEKNLQGDIVAIYDSEGTLCISYIYDAWGNCRASYESGYITSVARLNPFRYRGYYYDDDLKLYYLQSRYYDPNTCRFINADIYISTGYGIIGNNMFAYCNNIPTCYSDPEGTDITYDCDLDDDYDMEDDYQRYAGGGGGGGGSTGATSGSGSGNVGPGSASNSAYSGGLSVGNSTGLRTEVHHIVEQCQTYKSGFPNEMIQAESNKVILDYDVHRKISGFYLSKPDWANGVRVRDWLVGQSFEFQTKFGWQIVQTYRGY